MKAGTERTLHLELLQEPYKAQIVMRDPSGLKAYEGNARKHGEKQLAQLVASIRTFGFVVPVLVDANGMILAGHGRVEAARRIGLKAIPTLEVSHLTDAQKRAFIIADNKLAELSSWDKDILKVELKFLSDVDFEVETTGFSTAEIDIMFDPPADTKVSPDDELPDVPQGPAVTQPGDVWVMGQHRLICGDSTDPATYRALMGKDRAVMVFTDPPYNVKIDGHVCGLGKVKHREFAMAAGEMTTAQFTDFLSQVMTQLCRFSTNGSLHFVCMDWRHLGELLEAGRENYDDYKQLIVWKKDNAGMGAFYRSHHELVAVFKNGTASHINNFGLGEKGRYRTNVWEYPGVNSLKGNRRKELELHPTVKPVALVADALRDCSRRGDVVLDAFMGSGTTLIAAERTGRVCRGIELDPLYVDTAVRRWQELTGEQATLESTGQPFDSRESAEASHE